MTNIRRRLFAALAVMPLVLAPAAGTAWAAEMVIKHAQGETKLSTTPAKVLTFDIASLDTLTALGVDVAGVPKGNKPDYLAKYADGKVATIGTLFEPDYEAVNAAEPDLVIVAGRSRAKYADLAKIAPTIDLTVDDNRYLAGAKEDVLTLGRIFDKQAAAEALVATLDTSAAALKAKAAKAGNALLVLTTGGKMSTYGPGSRFGILFDEYGITPADANIKIGNHGQPASFEYVLEKNPDWLFVIDRDAAVGQDKTPASTFLDNDIIRQTKAWKAGHVVYLDPISMYIVGNGVTSMQKVIDEISARFDKP
jgi:iron complex transport system substrate-binding protein